MDTSEGDGSGRAEEETVNPIRPVVQGDAWRPAALAFRAYLPSTKGHQSGQKQFCGMVHSLRLVVSRPLVVKLTKDIIETYQTCNPTFTYSEAFNPKRYLTNPSVAASNGGLDNENSDLILAVNGVLVNADLNHRYIVKDLLGQGTFGQVAKCWADEKNRFVAVKIIKNQPAYYHQALVEISILNMLNHKFDPEDKHHIVRIFEHFVYHGHLCIVFEMLGVNLFELLKVNQFRGISLNLLRLFTKQILTALMVLRDASVIHCDLKPENILLTTSPQSAEIKLIDFGSACMESRTVYSYIQSRFYRSPEVVLGHSYTTAIDMWSFGCVAAELFLGLPLFPGLSQYDLLQRMIEILGSQPPDDILRKAKNTNKYFKHAGAPTRQNDRTGEGQQSAYQFLTLAEYELREKENPTIGKRYHPGNLEEIIANYPMRKRMSQDDIERENNLRFIFVDFLKGLVNFDPLKRWTPRQAAQHPFVTEEPFTAPFRPLPETPRTPISQGMTVEHNPVSGHWFGAGLSPQVVSLNVGLQYGSPQYHGAPFSYASSYGSVGSYGSFGDGGGGLGSSFGSYGDASGLYMNYRTPSAIGNAGFGVSPDTWRRMGPMPPNALGHANLGLSPSSGFFRPMSLGASPSQFTPPSSHFQASPGSPSTGSPSRYGPTSPARGGGVTTLGKAAAVGQYNKRRGYGSPGSAISAVSGAHGSVQDNIPGPWHGIYQNAQSGNGETSPGSYIESTIRGGYLGSPRNASMQGTHHAPHLRQRNGIVAGTNSGQIQNSKTSINYPSGSLGAFLSNTETASDGGEDTSPPPDPGDWDPNYSEEQLLQDDGGDVVPLTVSSVSPSGAAGTGGTRLGLGFPLNMGPGPGLGPSARVNRNYLHLQGGSPNGGFRPSGMMPVYMEGSPQSLQGYGRNVSKPSHHGPYSQQNSPSRLGQQPAQLLQQQLQYQYYSTGLHSPDQPLHLSPVTQQQLNHQYHAQNIQSPDQPLHFYTFGNNHTVNGDAGVHGLLPSPKRDGRPEHSQNTAHDGNSGLHGSVGHENYLNPGSGYPGGLGIYKPTHGLHTQDRLNHMPDNVLHRVAGFPPPQGPSSNPNESHNGRRTGPSNGALPPTPGRKDRRTGL